MMDEIQYQAGGVELLDSIQPLWEQLNQHHAEISPYFSDDFCVYSFERRTEKLRKKFKDEQLKFIFANSGDASIGYCIAGIRNGDVGEIESIYILSDYRGQGIGDELMRRALAWLDQQGVRSTVIDVAYGNERAFKFYARFGFYPRVTMLKQKREMKV